jgi:hypothetical protein
MKMLFYKSKAETLEETKAANMAILGFKNCKKIFL